MKVTMRGQPGRLYPHPYPQEILRYSFLLDTQSSPACSAVPKSTEPPRVPLKRNQLNIIQNVKKYFPFQNILYVIQSIQMKSLTEAHGTVEGRTFPRIVYIT
jgi:hypothetical protein